MKKRIGDLYDRAKFDKAIEEAAREFIKDVMDDFADSPTGNEVYSQLLSKLKRQIREVPVEYYRALEAFVDGEDISRYVVFSDKEKDMQYFKDQGIRALPALLTAHKDGVWRVIDPEGDVRYYESRFPEGTRRTTVAKDLKLALKSVKDEIRNRLDRFDSEREKVRDDNVKMLLAIRKEHAAFIEEKGIDRHDPAYGLLSGLYTEFKKENRTLAKLEDMVMRIKRKLVPYEVKKEYGVVTLKELAEHDALVAKEEMATRDLECYMNALDELGEVRFKNGIISEKLYLMQFDELPEKARSKKSTEDTMLTEGERIELSFKEKSMSETEEPSYGEKQVTREPYEKEKDL